mgnify:CR=1 FL=1
MNNLKIKILRNNYEGYTPSDYKINRWAKHSLINRMNSFVVINFFDKKNIEVLNMKFLKKPYPCNILTFPMKTKLISGEHMLGDIIICPSVVNQESKKFNFKKDARWAHMIIHSMLHLQGYSHSSKKNRIIMEKKEILLMKKLGYKNPYYAN